MRRTTALERVRWPFTPGTSALDLPLPFCVSVGVGPPSGAASRLLGSTAIALVLISPGRAPLPAGRHGRAGHHPHDPRAARALARRIPGAFHRLGTIHYLAAWWGLLELEPTTFNRRGTVAQRLAGRVSLRVVLGVSRIAPLPADRDPVCAGDRGGRVRLHGECRCRGRRIRYAASDWRRRRRHVAGRRLRGRSADDTLHRPSGHKAMGGRSAYTLATALFVGGAGLLGYFGYLYLVIPRRPSSRS